MGIWLIFLFLKAVVNILIQTLLIRHDCYFVRWSSLSWSLGCLWSNRKNRKPHRISNPKTRHYFSRKAKTECWKTENPQTVINTKTEKPRFFWHKNRKTDLKNCQNSKTENPDAPLGYRQRKIAVNMLNLDKVTVILPTTLAFVKLSSVSPGIL